MSKSLKNFITIKDALEKNSRSELRIFFLQHMWNATLDYSTNAMEEASVYEKMLREFFLNVKDLMRDAPSSTFEYFQKWDEADVDLNNKFVDLKHNVRVALCDNINTKTALDRVRKMITHCNRYIAAKPKIANIVLLKNIAEYITRLFQTFGVIDGKQTIGFPSESAGSADVEAVMMPVLEALADFREEVRQEARSLKASKILDTCDKVRDDVLPNLGVRLEDRDNQRASLKLEPREKLLREREEKRLAEEVKRLEKERKKAELAAKEAEKEAKRRVPPTEMFKGNLSAKSLKTVF